VNLIHTERQVIIIGGKPNKGTSKDMRLKGNKGKPKPMPVKNMSMKKGK
jgi:hypothetical protein